MILPFQDMGLTWLAIQLISDRRGVGSLFIRLNFDTTLPGTWDTICAQALVPRDPIMDQLQYQSKTSQEMLSQFQQISESIPMLV